MPALVDECRSVCNDQVLAARRVVIIKLVVRNMLLLLLFVHCFAPPLFADDGYDLWLKYRVVQETELLEQYRESLSGIIIPGNSRTLEIVRGEIHQGLRLLLGKKIPEKVLPVSPNTLVVGTPHTLPSPLFAGIHPLLESAGPEGFVIATQTTAGGSFTLIASLEEVGALRGAFHFLRLLQTYQDIDRLSIVSKPRVQFRLLNHWDNLDGSVERGYAGRSLWQWDDLPGKIESRYVDYARANASLGINGVVLNNVNANPEILRTVNLKKVAALADVFRPFGIKVFLSANFSSPISAEFRQEENRKGGIGDLSTSDPLNPDVRAWWKQKAKEMYELIPDFGGFLVKANSEGMPGPQDYGRTHADGANMLADAVAPYEGVVMWRAFVYNADVDPDRIKRAYMEFVPLDGQFRPNVFIQPKNGPLDFQPREPVNSLFGAMPNTPLMLELQITQEYLGHSTHLVYLARMWKEYLEFDMYANGPGATLASIVDGTVHQQSMTGIAGVANVGRDRNWTGHFFGQANWYAFGRLAWDHTLSAEQIADEWVRMSVGNDSIVVATVQSIMMESWEACVNYMTPLGLHHIMQEHVHYGPGPDVAGGSREDWTSVYYHRADSNAIGFDRSSSGSNAVSQYFPPLRETLDDVNSCPEKYLLWFHHVPWDHKMRSGRTLWDELCRKYYLGTDTVDSMYKRWLTLEPIVDPALFAHVRKKLEQQRTDAALWRDTCLGYFQKFSGKPISVSP